MIRTARTHTRAAAAAVAAAVAVLCAACGGDDAAGALPTLTPSTSSTAAASDAAGTPSPSTSASSTSGFSAFGEEPEVERVYRGYLAARAELGASGVADPDVMRPWGTKKLADLEALGMAALFKNNRRMIGTITTEVRSVTITEQGATLVACTDNTQWKSFVFEAGRATGPGKVSSDTAAVINATLVREGDTWRMADYDAVATC